MLEANDGDDEGEGVRGGGLFGEEADLWRGEGEGDCNEMEGSTEEEVPAAAAGGSAADLTISPTLISWDSSPDNSAALNSAS